MLTLKVFELRFRFSAPLHLPRAPGVKSAPLREVDRAGNLSLKEDSLLFHLGIGDGDC